MSDYEALHDPELRPNKTSGSLLLFFVKFLVLVALLSWAWWEYGMPKYAELVATIGPRIFASVFGHEGIRGHVILDPQDLFNTKTVLVWIPPDVAEDKLPPHMYFGPLVTNIPPYLALVLATAGLAFWRRVWIALVGVLILMSTHVAYLVIAFEYRDALVTVTDRGTEAAKIPQALEIFFLTLPFLLWIVLAYWEKLGDYFGSLSNSGDDFPLQGASLLPEEDQASAKGGR